MNVVMLNKNIPNNDVKEAGLSCKALLPGGLGMQGQVPGGCNQANTNKTPLNADNEDNVMVLEEEEWEDLFGNSMDLTKLIDCRMVKEDKSYIKTYHN